jgi:CheY-like chemotaxis protein
LGLRRKRVLVVDDEEPMRAWVSECLSQAGYRVADVAGGAEALDELMQHDYDALVVDIVMPGTGGVEVIRTALGIRPELGIVAMSGAMQSVSYLEIARLVGSERLLMKPFEAESLLGAVRGALGQP